MRIYEYVMACLKEDQDKQMEVKIRTAIDTMLQFFFYIHPFFLYILVVRIKYLPILFGRLA